MITFSPSKINIGLFITQKRPDGFHNLESVFVPIPFYDVLEIIPSNDNIDFDYHNLGIAIDCSLEKNTCYKAFQYLKKDYPQLSQVSLYHYKNIPTGMGLGGGSANAVYAVQLLNKMFHLNLSTEYVHQCYEHIGSDCLFFHHNKPSFITSKGDNIEPYPLDLRAYQCVLLLPRHIAVNTAWAYSKMMPKPAITNLKLALQKPIKTWRQHVFNDFERVVFEAYPLLHDAQQELYHRGALYASMSGSGACVYGLFDKNQIIDTTQWHLKNDDFDIRIFPFPSHEQGV